MTKDIPEAFIFDLYVINNINGHQKMLLNIFSDVSIGSCDNMTKDTSETFIFDLYVMNNINGHQMMFLNIY